MSFVPKASALASTYGCRCRSLQVSTRPLGLVPTTALEISNLIPELPPPLLLSHVVCTVARQVHQSARHPPRHATFPTALSRAGLLPPPAFSPLPPPRP